MVQLSFADYNLEAILWSNTLWSMLVQSTKNIILSVFKETIFISLIDF